MLQVSDEQPRIVKLDGWYPKATGFAALIGKEKQQMTTKRDAPLSWNNLNPAERVKIARAAGFSESDSAFAAKIKWQGFPVQIINALYAIDWKKVLA